MERLQGMTHFAEIPISSPSPIELVHQVLSDCFDPVSPHSIDRYSDSPHVRGLYAAVAEAFPDTAFSPSWFVAEEDRVVVGGTARGTQSGGWRGVPATGKRFEALTVVMFEVSDGRVVDLTVVTDSLAIAEQLGIVEPLGPKACERPATVSGATPCGDALFERLDPWGGRRR